MSSVLHEVWKLFQYYILPVLPLLALVLIEIQLMYYRRENEVMFGTDAFNEKIKAFEFTPKEVRTLEKLVRTSVPGGKFCGYPESDGKCSVSLCRRNPEIPVWSASYCSPSG